MRLGFSLPTPGGFATGLLSFYSCVIPAMYNNTTSCVCHCNRSNFENNEKNHSCSSYIMISWSASIAFAILSPVAVVGNALVLAAIWRNPSLRTPSYILLAGLAFTDFSTGLITQPFYAAMELMNLSGSLVNPIVVAIANGSGMFFIPMTTSIITLMSIERWLHMTRRSLLTVPRVYSALAVLHLVIFPFAICSSVLSNFNTKQGTDITSMLFLLACLIVTSTAYAKVFRIIRSHQQQIQSNCFSRPSAQPVINVAKYRKSVNTVFYIVGIFYVSYSPISITFVLLLTLGREYDSLTASLLDLSLMFLFLSSSLNPFLYMWRMNDIRNEITRLVKIIFRKDN